MPPDLETPLRRGEPLGVLFDANPLLDVFLQRANAYPAARALTLAEADAVKGHVCASAFGVICHHGAASGPDAADAADANAAWRGTACGFSTSCR